MLANRSAISIANSETGHGGSSCAPSHSMLAVDLLTVDAVLLGRLHVLVVIELAIRRVHLLG